MRSLILMAAVFLLPLFSCARPSVSSDRISVFFIPSQCYSGEIVLVKVFGLQENSSFALVTATPVIRTNRALPLRNGYAFLVGIPEEGCSRLVYRLYQGNVLVFSNQVPVYERRRSEVAFSVENKYIRPDPALNRRLQQEALLLKKARSHYTNSVFFDSHPVYPVTNRKQGSPFGERRVLNGVKQSVHYGIDLSSSAGDDVRSLFPGRVLLASNLYYGGKTVMIQHGLGLVSQYSHLSTMLVREGAWVSNGMVIGRVGSTGMSTGPHLHFSTYYGSVAVDPLSVIAYMRELW
jgi:murein DD-endopeptidase MepM/ murein hydrolase activator NlpD